MPSSCKELYNAVVECLRASDCIKNGYSPAECIRMPLKEQLPAQCQNLLHAYGECKLSFKLLLPPSLSLQSPRLLRPGCFK
ncbi:hypothetical protein TWF718_008367 [Orbilia javanica]|uniref:Cytochrome c oxidase assembly factor 5 n=1 Tax=Orbilia javanica TaxID=47235 RepID=A0AAN8RMU7_9PEZI